MKPEIDIPEAELRAAYARTSLASLGIPYDQAKASPAILITLRGAVIAGRRSAARRAAYQSPTRHQEAA